MQIKIIILFFVIYLETGETFIGSSMKKLKNKAKGYYKSKFGKDTTWHFLGHDLTEYPGTNEKYRKINQEKWEEYYTCLRKQLESLGAHKSISPEAVLAFEGAYVQLECKICLSPKERQIADSVEWYFAHTDSEKLELLEYTEHLLVNPDDKTLQMYNLGEENSGQYACQMGETISAPYYLTVANSTVNITRVHSESAPSGPYPKQPEIIREYNLILDTEWGDWSSCSQCDKVGKRHRFGYCTVIIQDSSITEVREDTSTAAIPVNVTSATSKSAIKKSVINKTELELLKIFKNGIPCLSHILPVSIKNYPILVARSSEIMVGYCKNPCPEEQIFEVKDQSGNVIERANNSAGYYSLLQGLPPIEPPVERRLQYERMGEHIILSCPGNLNSDAPIQWQIGSKIIVPELLAQESSGRVYVSITDKIHIKKAKITDSKVYSCWQHKNLAGTVRLVIEKKVKLNFNHHIMLIGMVIILTTFLYVFTKAIFGRKYAKITK